MGLGKMGTTKSVKAQRDTGSSRHTPLSELNPNPVLEISSDGRLTYANDATKKLLADYGDLKAVRRLIYPGEKEVFEQLREKGGKREMEVAIGPKVLLASAYSVPGTRAIRIYTIDITERKKTEEMLKASAEKFKALYDSSADAIMTLEPPSWNFTAGNPASIRMFGCKNERDFVSRGPWQYSPEKQPNGKPSSDEAKRMIMKAMKDGSNFFEWDHMRLNKEVFPATVLLTRVTIGGKSFLQATVRDISKEKAVETKMRESEERFKKLFESTNDATFVADAETRKLVDCNRKAVELVGRPKAQILSMRADELHPKDRVKETMEGFSKQAKGELNIVETEVLTKSGKRIPVEVNAAAFAAGGRNYVVGTFRNTTERKKYEELYRLLVDGNPDAIIAGDLEGRLTLVNDACEKLFGYGRNELIGKRLFEFISPSDLPMVQKGFGDILTQGSQPASVAREFRVISKKGEEIPVEVSGAPLTEGGRLIGIMSVLRDLRERRAAEKLQEEYGAKLESEVKVRTAELLRARKAKDEFLSVTTHELKTPLVPIKMQSELWLTGAYGKISAKQRESFDMILRNTARLMRLVDEVLLISKIEGATLKYSFAKMDLGKALRETVGESMEAANRKRIALTSGIAAGKMMMEGDEMRLKEVFSNLLSNAVKFTPEGGSISVASKVSGKNVLVSVTDTGIGMSEEYQGRMFEKFQQADQAITRKYGGTGLGLAICHAIVTKHKGRIWVESALGKGTTVFVMLPLKGGFIK